MLMLVQISDTLTLCKEWRGTRAPEDGMLVPVLGNGLQLRISSVEDDLIHVYAPVRYRVEDVFRANGWTDYRVEKPLIKIIQCREGGEHFSIGWAATRKIFEFPDGTHCAAKFLRAWKHDKYPGVVVCEYKRVHVAVCA